MENNSKIEPTNAIRQNIEAIARLEGDYNRNRSTVDKIADVIGTFAGSLKFVVLHAVVFGIWILGNLQWIPGFRRFDPFPFMLLSMVVSLEAIFLSTFVLIKQNRMSRRADQRAHLDLQINLLAEQEMTVMLQMLQNISTRLGVSLPDEKIEELAEPTPVHVVADELQKTLDPS